MVLQALLAVAAQAAGAARTDGDAVAGLVLAHAAADLLDDAGHLVAEHHRLLDAHGAEAAMLVVVQVRPADAAAAHAHAQLAGPDLGRGHVFDAQIAGGVDDESVHVPIPIEIKAWR